MNYKLIEKQSSVPARRVTGQETKYAHRFLGQSRSSIEEDYQNEKVRRDSRQVQRAMILDIGGRERCRGVRIKMVIEQKLWKRIANLEH